jgi:hypothetical protein
MVWCFLHNRIPHMLIIQSSKSRWLPKRRNEREKLKGMQVIGRTGSLRVVSKVVDCVNSACPFAQHTGSQQTHRACSVLLGVYKIFGPPLPLKLRFTQYHTHPYESPTLTLTTPHKTHARTHYKIWVASFNRAQVDSSISTAPHASCPRASCPTNQHIANRTRVARISRANF